MVLCQGALGWTLSIIQALRAALGTVMLLQGPSLLLLKGLLPSGEPRPAAGGSLHALIRLPLALKGVKAVTDLAFLLLTFNI